MERYLLKVGLWTERRYNRHVHYLVFTLTCFILQGMYQADGHHYSHTTRLQVSRQDSEQPHKIHT